MKAEIDYIQNKHQILMELTNPEAGLPEDTIKVLWAQRSLLKKKFDELTIELVSHELIAAYLNGVMLHDNAMDKTKLQ